jgi:FkbM family methyltransferase
LTALRDIRRAGGTLKRYLFPRPEVAAWRHACRQAAGAPRFTRGSIRLCDYQLQYPDLLTLCPQWHDLFVHNSVHFRSPRPDPRILDCGANLGLASLYLKRLYPAARITAFEADPAIHEILVSNLQANGATDVEAVHAAVWTQPGEITFQCEGADSGSIQQFAAADVGRSRAVPAMRLRDLLLTEKVDLLKLDIEGAEYDVLEDCRDALGNVGAILMDLHEFDPMRRVTPRVLNLLIEQGFLYSFDDLGPMPWRKPVAADDSPFPAEPLCWTALVRAWKA